MSLAGLLSFPLEADLLFLGFSSPHSAGLQMKIVAEDKIVDSRIKELVFEWEANK